MDSKHRAWAEINLGAFRRNLRRTRKQAGKAAVWPVLKANAYGHGAIAIARACAEEGVERLGVGDSREAIQLRYSGVELPLLVLGTVINAEVPDLLEHNVEVGVHSESRVHALGDVAREHGKTLGVHLKVDTGMGRLGVRPEAVLRVAGAIAAEPALQLRGLMTHYASSQGTFDEFTHGQHALFLAAAAEVSHELGARPTLHSANSAALYTNLHPIGDAVRPGISLFGIQPENLGAKVGLEPVLSLRTQIVFIKDIPAATPVGYEGCWTSHLSKTRIATLPIGYNDGIPYRVGLSGNGQVLVRGQRCPLIGTVSMDYCTIDITHVTDASVGDVVTLIGKDGLESISTCDVARVAGTIPYEITCRLGSRVKRCYHEDLGFKEASGNMSKP
ncbi:MAG: alanine racemase [Planctomycetota bacterium]|nr:alanine racemase [Planctomycetota bacterium]